MFIRLTRLDSTPIWINASFVVTVEPRRGGGAIVVPIGDGLDYDVKESPEAVLEMLDGAPAPAVVPVPAPKGLTVTPEDVSPADPSPADDVAEPPKPAPAAEPPAKPVKKTARSRSRKSAKAETSESSAQSEDASAGGDAAEPAAPAEQPAAGDKPKRAKTTRKPRKPVSTLTGDQVERLVKMAPGSIRKLQNTLAAQFRVEDIESEIAALQANGVFTLDRDHIVWATA